MANALFGNEQKSASHQRVVDRAAVESLTTVMGIANLLRQLAQGELFVLVLFLTGLLLVLVEVSNLFIFASLRSGFFIEILGGLFILLDFLEIALLFLFSLCFSLHFPEVFGHLLRVAAITAAGADGTGRGTCA